MSTNAINSVAMVGATGQLGTFIIAELQRQSPHLKVTALSRTNTSSLPPSVNVATVDYNNHATLVDAMRGHDLLIITLAVTAPPDTHNRLVDAAADAGVRWLIPNVWGVDPGTEAAQKESLVTEANMANLAHAEKRGLTWTAVSCGFWYEYSLSGGKMMYGIDATAKEALLYDGGKVPLSTSTWEQTARTVSALLALPVQPSDANDTSVTLSRWANKHVHVDSFTLTQREMLDAVQKVTNTTDVDWTIETPSSRSVYDGGIAQMMKGDRNGFATALYSRMFFPDEPANFVKTPGLDNDVLKLPKEDLLACTKKAVDMQKNQYIANRFKYMNEQQVKEGK